MRKLSDVGKGLNKINEGFEFDPQNVDYSLYYGPLDKKLRDSLGEVLRQSNRGEVITEHKEERISHKKHPEPLMTFERFMERNHN